jgi:hypothetical protein
MDIKTESKKYYKNWKTYKILRSNLSQTWKTEESCDTAVWLYEMYS